MSVRQNKRNHRTRFLSTDELTRLAALLASAREGEDRTEQVHATAIALLVLTGCRVGEVLCLQWGDEARELVQSLPRANNNPWLFWNWRFHQPIQDIIHIWHRYRSELGLKDVHLHDLRHTFACHAVMAKENLQMIGRLLGHASVKSTARYAHFDDAHLLDAAEIIGASIDRAMLTGSHASILRHPIKHDILYDMYRVVLDTDIIVTALRSATGGSNAVLREAAHGRITPLVTPALFLEYEAVLKRPEQRLVHGLGLRDIDRFLSALAAACEAVEVSFQWRPQLSDANDEMVLEAAVNGQADALITHNVRDFAKGAERFGLRVLRPGELLKELRL